MSIFNKKSYIAAISGGPDSMALLYFFRHHIKAVCIVDYQLRDQSKLEVKNVQEFCKKYNIVCELKIVPLEVYENIDNFQNFARQLRYDFFYETAKKYNANTLLLAHHLDDYLETAYYQKMRHSKALYYGINPDSKYKDLKLYRPFLFKFRKADLEQFCIDKNIMYYHDESNFSDQYERNKIRKIIQSWDVNTFNLFKKEIFHYNNLNRIFLKQVYSSFKKWNHLHFQIDYLLNQDLKMQYYLIYEFLKINLETNKSEKKINSILDFLQSRSLKLYRLENNKALKINNFCLECIENEWKTN